MTSSTKTEAKSTRDISYYQQRFRNRVFSKLVGWIADESHARKLTQKDIAEIIRKDPATISRMLRNPGNLTLDTISDILLAFDAEAEPPEIVRFRDRRQANYMHPLMARALNLPQPQNISRTAPTTAGEKVFSIPRPHLELKVDVSASSGR